MINLVRTALLAGVCAICGSAVWPRAAITQEAAQQAADNGEDPEQAADLAAEEYRGEISFVWLAEPEDGAEISAAEQANRVETLVAAFGPKVLTEYPLLGGVAVRGSVEETQQIVDQQLRPTETGFGVDIAANAAVQLFDSGCNDPDEWPTLPGTNTPTELPISWNINMVGGSITPATTNRVWLIDSGVDKETADKDLNVLGYYECFGRSCRTEKAGRERDTVGHGTHIAGIIGARNNDAGVVGVAEGAQIISLRVFRANGRANLDAIFNALEFIKQKQNVLGPITFKSRDVINISWGLVWDPFPSINPNGKENLTRKLESDLQGLADLGARVVVAAGNNDTLEGSGYVETVSPARAGGYRSPSGDGGIVTVSAVDEQKTFWPDSAFGNGDLVPAAGGEPAYYRGPPDFAEPGVAIKSLWPRLQVAVCTGTSFAAAHMSGMLMEGRWPIPNGLAQGDPSAQLLPGETPPATSKLDRIGRHP